MPIYKSMRIEKPVYDSLVALLLPRETYSQLIQRLVNFHNAVKLDVVLASTHFKGEEKKGG